MATARQLIAVITAMVTLAVGISFTAPARAEASPINECGNWIQTNGQPGTWHWSYGYQGVSPVRNLTTRNTRCAYARSFTLHLSFSYQRHYQAYACRWRWPTFADYDVRCTKGSHVIHWQGHDLG